MIKLLFIFVSVLNVATPLYFNMDETERKCFVEEIPEETLVVGTYRIESLDPHTREYHTNDHIGIFVHIIDPNEHDIQNTLHTATGKFTFTSHSPGEHQICLKSNSTNWMKGSMLRVHFRIDVGEHAQDYQQIGTANRLTELQIRVKQLIDQCEQIAKEQDYHRGREQKYRQKADKINKEIIMWGLAQLVTLACAGFWQMRHLRRFFEAKKLV